MPEDWESAPVVLPAKAEGWESAPVVASSTGQPETSWFMRQIRNAAYGNKVRQAATTALDRGIDNLLHGKVSGNLDAMKNEFLDYMEAKPQAPVAAASILDAAQAGYQQSTLGLVARGKRPEIVLDPHHATWLQQQTAAATQLVSDLPAMVLGGMAAGVAALPTGPGAVAAGGAGAFAMPTAIREALMTAYTLDDVQSSSEFLTRTGISVMNTVRDAEVGALTSLTGLRAGQGIAPGTSKLVAGAKVAGAEVGTMTVAPALLEGRLPEPEEFVNAAIMVGGLHGATHVAGKLMTIYEKTGMRPEEVLAAAEKDPTIKEDLTKPVEPEAQPEIPKALEPLATAQAVAEAVPGLAPAVGSELMLPRMEVPGEPQPTHVNYKYLNTPDHVNAALAKMSELNLEQIQKQRRGTVSWEQTQREAGQALDALLGSPADMAAIRQPGTPAGAAELLARKQLIEGAANDMAVKAKELMELGTNATPEQQAAFLASIDRTAMIQAEFLGARAEAGRALNILKETKVASVRAQQIKELIARFGEDPLTLAERIAAIEDPSGLIQTPGKILKATTWEKMMEGYSAFLVSGPHTQVANVLGNMAMAASRPMVDLAAATGGAIFRADNPVHFSEAIYRAKANILSLSEGLKLAKEAFLTGSADSKMEHKQAIEGTLGHVIRTPFRALDAMDVVFKYMNERGEALALGAKSASEAGLTFGTREFYEHAAQFANNPPEKAINQIEDFARRMTFKSPLNEVGQKFNALVKAGHLEWMFPFRMTPANIFKEMIRISPAAPLSEKWRADYQAGGPAQTKALAELAIGSAMATLGMSMAFDGHISGGGDPDPNKRRVMAPGWQPYSMKIGNTWYSYQRIQPFGTLVGMAADMAEAWKHMNPDERDKVPKILTMAFSNGITNQTFLQGLTQVVDAISQPDKKGERFIQNLVAGATVPALASQTAALMDPYKREVTSILEAVQSRIPGLRENLMPQRDPFGQPIPEPDRLGGIGPITTKEQSTDKVLIEAGRLADIPGLAVSAAKAPKEIQIQAAGQRDIGRVQLTPEQRDVYALEAGTLAHQVLTEIVNGPDWDRMSDMQQALVFNTVLSETRKYGEAKALPPEQRQKEVDRIVAALENRIAKPHKR